MRKFLTILWAILIPSLLAHAQDEMTGISGEVANDTVRVSQMALVASASQTELDVNGDGLFNVADIVDIVRYVRGNARSVFNKSKADFNGDGVVDLEDAKLLSVGLTGGEMPVATTVPADKSTVLRGDSLIDPVGPQ